MNLPKGFKLDHIKTCTCGKVYANLPVKGHLTSLGIWFDCTACGSNNLVVSGLKDYRAAREKHGTKKNHL